MMFESCKRASEVFSGGDGNVCAKLKSGLGPGNVKGGEFNIIG
jgi:hypothetical protein